MANRVIILLLFSLALSIKASAETNIIPTAQTYTYEKMSENLVQLKNAYKDLLKIKILGYSHFGRKIYAVQLGTGRKNVLLVGAHHGREWITSMLLMKMLETYAAAAESHMAIGKLHSELLNDVSLWFVPMLNPDGVTIQQNQLQSFPPGQQNYLMFMNEGWDDYIRWKANGMGVDLNRQYPAGWKDLNTEQQSPSYQFYKGKAPLEAAEAAALVSFVNEIKPSIAVAYHTAGQEIYWKYKNGKNTKRDRALAQKIAKLTGYKLAKPPKNASGGGFTDWFIATCHKPALTIEMSYLVGDRHPPLSVFNEEWKRNKLVGLKLADEAKKLPD